MKVWLASLLLIISMLGLGCNDGNLHDGAGRMASLRPMHQIDLVGYYTCAALDTNYVFFIGSEGEGLNGKLFATTDALPADKMLHRALPSFAATEYFPLACDIDDMVFEGAIGAGSISWASDTVILHFRTFLGQPRDLDFVLWR